MLNLFSVRDVYFFQCEMFTFFSARCSFLEATFWNVTRHEFIRRRKISNAFFAITFSTILGTFTSMLMKNTSRYSHPTMFNLFGAKKIKIIEKMVHASNVYVAVS